MAGRRCCSRLLQIAASLLTLLGLRVATYGEATFTLINNDAPGIGFNDPHAVNPFGGNPGTTLGEQRLNAVRYAAEIWGGLLDSPVDIRVAIRSVDGCTFSGFAAVLSVMRDFAGAPVPNTWYPIVLASKLAGMDLCPPGGSCPSEDDMLLIFGRDCGLYVGLDNDLPPGRSDLVRTALHELGHGLGFTTPMNIATGQKLMGIDDIYMRHLEDHDTGKHYPEMTDAERVAGNSKSGSLHWIGSSVVAASTILSSGVHPSGHVEMHAPPILAIGSSVSHFSNSLFPDQVLEASGVRALEHDVGLALEVLRDLGWFVEGPARTASPTSSLTPLPTATPTPTQPPVPCPGDCDADRAVSIDELVLGVRIALNRAAADACRAFDPNRDAVVTADELVQAVGAALRSCAEAPERAARRLSYQQLRARQSVHPSDHPQGAPRDLRSFSPPPDV